MSPRPKPTPEPVAVKLTPPAAAPLPQPGPGPVPSVRRPRPALKPVVVEAQNREMYTDFFSLEEEPVSIDRGRMVRVLVPRSTMFRVGLPVDVNRFDDTIQADLVLSEEGIARAVRFVQ